MTDKPSRKYKPTSTILPDEPITKQQVLDFTTSSEKGLGLQNFAVLHAIGITAGTKAAWASTDPCDELAQQIVPTKTVSLLFRLIKSRAELQELILHKQLKELCELWRGHYPKHGISDIAEYLGMHPQTVFSQNRKTIRKPLFPYNQRLVNELISIITAEGKDGIDRYLKEVYEPERRAREKYKDEYAKANQRKKRKPKPEES